MHNTKYRNLFYYLFCVIHLFLSLNFLVHLTSYLVLNSDKVIVMGYFNIPVDSENERLSAAFNWLYHWPNVGHQPISDKILAVRVEKTEDKIRHVSWRYLNSREDGGRNAGSSYSKRGEDGGRDTCWSYLKSGVFALIRELESYQLRHRIDWLYQTRLVTINLTVKEWWGFFSWFLWININTLKLFLVFFVQTTDLLFKSLQSTTVWFSDTVKHYGNEYYNVQNYSKFLKTDLYPLAFDLA